MTTLKERRKRLEKECVEAWAKNDKKTALHIERVLRALDDPSLPDTNQEVIESAAERERVRAACRDESAEHYATGLSKGPLIIMVVAVLAFIASFVLR